MFLFSHVYFAFQFFSGYGWIQGKIVEVDHAKNRYGVLYSDGDDEVLRRADILKILVQGESAHPKTSPKERSTAEGPDDDLNGIVLNASVSKVWTKLSLNSYPL